MNHALRRTALAVFGTGCVAAQAAPLPVIGWIEPVAVADGRVVVDAKIDTGADVSSLHVEGLRIERRGEEDWAVFAVPQASGPALPLERRVERYAQVKRVAGDFTCAEDINVVLAEPIRYFKKRLEANGPQVHELDALMDRIVAEQRALGA